MNDLNRIIFEKPKLDILTKENVVVDMHFHTHYSDGLNSVEKVAEKARKLNIGIAITDHNEIRGAVEIDRYKDILTIPGIEVTTAEGSHLLVYFYDIKSLKSYYKKHVRPAMGNGVMSSLSMTMETAIASARAYRCVVVFPHPYCAAYTGVCNLHFPAERLATLYEMVDGVEVINAGNINKWNLKCAVLGFNLNKAITGGSDGHHLKQMGRAVTFAACGKSRKAFLDAIKKRETKVVGKEIAFINKLASNGFKLKTNIFNCPELFEKNIRYSYALVNSKSKALKDSLAQRLNTSIRKYQVRNNPGV